MGVSVEKNHRLQVLFLRANNLDDTDVAQICKALKPEPGQPSNKTLKVLDISCNPITSKSVESVTDMLETNRTLEYIGLAKNNLTNEDAEQILAKIGRQPFPADQVDAHQVKIKQRDQIIEKNKKLKNSKKPEEPVPILDSIEQSPGGEWSLLKNMQLRHVNLCMNHLTEEVMPAVEAVLQRTNDEFGITLSGNTIPAEIVKGL